MPDDYFYSLIHGLAYPFCSEATRGHKEDEFRVIFNDPATILLVNGEKYISKAHNEEFDKEKGLLMCLAKANGISHTKLRKLLENAETQTPKIKKERI